MNIEMVGIPGVGKSYLCRSIEAQLLAENTQGENAPLPLTTPALLSPKAERHTSTVEKLTRAIAFSCQHPITAMSLRKVIFGVGQKVQRSRATKYINLLSEMQRLRTPQAPFSLLTEQGVLQGIWSLEMLASESICERIMQLLAAWLPDAIIVVRAERSQHETQLVLRKLGRSNFDRLRGSQLSQAMDQGEVNLNRILALWTRFRPDGQRLDIHNHPENDTRTLYAWLSTQVR